MPRVVTTPDFDKFWAVYPLKINKLAAVRAYRVVRRDGVSGEELVAAVERYIASKPAYQSYCHASTWLRGMRWLDEDAPLTTTELAFAKTVMRKRLGQCFHEPVCHNSLACLNAIAYEMRTKRTT